MPHGASRGRPPPPLARPPPLHNSPQPRYLATASSSSEANHLATASSPSAMNSSHSGVPKSGMAERVLTAVASGAAGQGRGEGEQRARGIQKEKTTAAQQRRGREAEWAGRRRAEPTGSVIASYRAGCATRPRPPRRPPYRGGSGRRRTRVVVGLLGLRHGAQLRRRLGRGLGAEVDRDGRVEAQHGVHELQSAW
jgi:hypothetical protein